MRIGAKLLPLEMSRLFSFSFSSNLTTQRSKTIQNPHAVARATVAVDSKLSHLSQPPDLAWLASSSFGSGEVARCTRTMKLDSPFVHWHLDDRVGTIYLETAIGELVMVARSWSRGKEKLYDACPKFLAKYSDSLDVGTLLRWTSDAELNAWTNRIIYFSFMTLAEDNDDGFWFVTNIDAHSSFESADMPAAYGHFFQGYNKDIWVLLRDGNKVWPVCTTDGRFYAGWNNFWTDEDLRTGCKVVKSN